MYDVYLKPVADVGASHGEPISVQASRKAFTCLCVLGVVMLSGATWVAKAATAVPVAQVFNTDGKSAILSVEAAGVQIYDCRANASGALAWQFREPLAILTQDGKTIGRHFAGPTWQLADGGAIVGKVAAQKPGVAQKDIALLQLDVVGREGAGLLSKVTAVERLDTQGGNFAGACEQAGELHVEPYRAQYVFLGN